MKILVVEDDEAFSALVEAALEEQHYQVDRVTDAQSGWDWLDAYEYDLILLDLILPGKADGLCFCRELRAKGDLTPVLLMTANEAQSIKVQGLDAGADDYLVKPFDWAELLARVRALLRRGQDSLSPLLVWGTLELDPSSCEVVCQVQPNLSGATSVGTGPKVLALTAKEYSLLELLLRNPHRIFNAGALLDRLWDSEEAPSENAVRAHIKGLRRKLKQAGVGDPVETVYGLGYRLRGAPSQAEEPFAGAEQSGSTDLAAESPAGQPTPEPFQQQLERVWQRARKTYLEQVTALDGMVERLQQQSTTSSLFLTPEDWQQMRRQAHSLKGGLGSFGLHGAAAVAAQLQDLVEPALDEGSKSSDDSGAVPPAGGVLQPLLLQLRQALEAAVTLQLEPLAPDPPSPPEPLGQCWLATTDAALVERLTAIAVSSGITLDFLSLEDSLERCLLPREDGLSAGGGAPPQVVIWDLATVQSVALERLGGLPWIALIEGDSLPQRVKAVQGGSSCCVDRLAGSEAIMEAVAAQLQRLRQKQLGAAKLLAVDDDAPLLNLLEGMLQPWGVEVTLLSQPEQFWQVLQKTQPDLLLLDVEMPGVNGLDLCRVVRQDPQWCRLPILFLSSRRDGPLLEQLFAAGASDFLSKPVTGEMLVARVRNCLEQSALGQPQVLLS